MLVLTRHVDQDVHIGRDIRIRILAINGRQVQIGIDAPREVAIHRGELLDVVCRQNAASAQADQPENALRDVAQRVRSLSSESVYTQESAGASSAAQARPISQE